MYEAATVEDVQNAYAQLKVGDADVHWCVGVSGTNGEKVEGADGVSSGGGGGGGGSSFRLSGHVEG